MAYHKAGSGSHQFNSFTRDEVQRIAANIADWATSTGWVNTTRQPR
jgi:predicted neutral ceramidase superfamily lipid hydrolase